MHLIRRNTCRVCGSDKLTPAINLGNQWLQGSFVKVGKEMPSTRKIPTALVRCDPMLDENACGLLQNEFTTPTEVLYLSYWYRSGTSNTMRNQLSGIVSEITKMFEKVGVRATSTLDIGCNDGTLLNYYPSGFKKYGIDPCDIALEIKPPIHVISDTFPSQKLALDIGDDLFDIITSIAMFYDLNDPKAFVREIKRMLSPTGIWCMEMSYMPAMLRNTSYDMINHEHIEYYSLAVIEYILHAEGMRVVRANENNINGGSFRCYATHTDNHVFDSNEFQEQVKTMRQVEFDLELDTDKPYAQFRECVNAHRIELNALLRQLKTDGKKIHIYGASTKGNTILQWCGIDNTIIDYASERNPDKYGARTLGTDIPIISEEESRTMKPDYYLVLPWHFKEEFLQREHEALENGTGFIFPLPKIDIIHGKEAKQL